MILHKLEKYLFWVLVIGAIALIAIPKFYITGDGPSHTYNAKVLFDFIKGDHRDFYKEYYTINRNLDPNWTAQILLGVLLQIFPYWLADKLTQILYVLLFAFGFRYLIKNISKQNSFLSLLFFPFCFTLPFQQGFYNYSLGMAMALFTIGYFIKYKNNLEPINLLVLSILTLFTTMSHGMASGHAVFIIALLYFIENKKSILQKNTINNFILLGLAVFPSVIIVGFFTLKKGFSTTPHSLSVWQKLKNFLQMYCSQSTRNDEMYIAVFAGILILIYVVFAFIKNKKNNIAIGFTAFAIFTFISYVRCPNDIGGAGSIDIRLAFLPPLFLLIALASFEWNNTFKNIFIAASILIQFSFIAIRYTYIIKASKEGEKIMEASKYIKDNSNILTLHYNDYGKQEYFQKDNSFLHFTDYYGAEKGKHLINILNYEADLIYFPVNWHKHTNPRHSINNMYQGCYPPCGNISDYEKQIQKQVDYVLLYGKTTQNDSCSQSIQKFIDSNYSKVFVNEYIQVFEKK